NKNFEMWEEYDKRIDEKGKERYKCKACKKEWAKNATRLQEHLQTCTVRNLTSNESSESSTRSAIYAVLAEDSIEINDNVKETILDYGFWIDLKKLHDFLEPFIIFIRQLESDEPYLSLVYKTLQNLKNKVTNNSQIPEELRADNEDQVLNELSEYIGKSGGFAKKYLWNDLTLKPLNWWNLLVKDLQSDNIVEQSNNQSGDENEKPEDNFVDFSNRLLNMFDNDEHDNYLEE
ncbi:13827_t:CDS:2, partial [Racocetra fulgida]